MTTSGPCRARLQMMRQAGPSTRFHDRQLDKLAWTFARPLGRAALCDGPERNAAFTTLSGDSFDLSRVIFLRHRNTLPACHRPDVAWRG